MILPFPPARPVCVCDPASVEMARSELVEWIEKYSGENQDGELMEWLKDGRVLCGLANGLSNEPVIKVRSKSKHTMFHALESVSSFLRWCINTVNIPKYHCFTAPELLESQNEEMVFKTLEELRYAFEPETRPPASTPREAPSPQPVEEDEGVEDAIEPKKKQQDPSPVIEPNPTKLHQVASTPTAGETTDARKPMKLDKLA